MHPGKWSWFTPDKRAITMVEDGSYMTYRELDERSAQVANWLQDRGVEFGDRIAILMENRPEYLVVAWAARRSGLRYVPVYFGLKEDEAAHLITDSEARVLFTSTQVADLATRLIERTPQVVDRLVLGGPLAGHTSYEIVVPGQPTECRGEEVEGAPMYYSSGTTGRPKGIVRELPWRPVGSDSSFSELAARIGLRSGGNLLISAALSHAAPQEFAIGALAEGARVTLQQSFDPWALLEAIQEHRCTHVYLVPAMMHMLWEIGPEDRSGYDLSSLRGVIHTGAPCPPDLKRRMIDWLGEFVWEVYSSSERHGVTMISSREWLEHEGSVGRPLPGCTIHITNPAGKELPSGSEGLIRFAGGTPMQYHNDPEKTASVYDTLGRGTSGDIGYLDVDGFLYITGRDTDTIIVGAVNVYPAEIENHLISHPSVRDVAVIGVPDEFMGQTVKALVVRADPNQAGPALSTALTRHCREGLAHYKVPSEVEFVEQLPRDANGKLRRGELSD